MKNIKHAKAVHQWRKMKKLVTQNTLKVTGITLKIIGKVSKQ